MKHTKEKLQLMLDEHGTLKAVAEILGYSSQKYLSTYINRNGWRAEKTIRLVDIDYG
tara:strand:- start:2147 stop:2317 length:171 start_codon:yes stop_codon:yes gene_type:complete